MAIVERIATPRRVDDPHRLACSLARPVMGTKPLHCTRTYVEESDTTTKSRRSIGAGKDTYLSTQARIFFPSKKKKKTRQGRGTLISTCVLFSLSGHEHVLECLSGHLISSHSLGLVVYIQQAVSDWHSHWHAWAPTRTYLVHGPSYSYVRVAPYSP